MESTRLIIMMFSQLIYFSLAQGSGGSLIISPDKSQFFEYKSVSLSCDVQGNSAGWKVWKNSADGKHLESEVNYDIKTAKTSDSGEYWCESTSGEQSNTVYITVHGGHVILESPALPVTEGHSVTLRCRYKTTPSDLTADFYKDGSFIRTETRGEMTIPVVNKSDEGLYSCRLPELGESPESWMSVTGSIPAPSPIPDVSLSRLLCSLLVVSPYLVVTTVLVVKWYRSRA
ncbi:hypothetical protein DPEC_G00106520 [Dallia pectoralis]|uniref:Uncharacterized protein n=1 Tax=Dallia pectoralis TaxID=75939 RepID=A0ACC2GYI6_DALPE|nr:hypothetical protein DPEC_G00106520 [Dallia pectoralis]